MASYSSDSPSVRRFNYVPRPLSAALYFYLGHLCLFFRLGANVKLRAKRWLGAILGCAGRVRDRWLDSTHLQCRSPNAASCRGWDHHTQRIDLSRTDHLTQRTLSLLQRLSEFLRRRSRVIRLRHLRVRPAGEHAHTKNERQAVGWYGGASERQVSVYGAGRHLER